MIDIFNLALDAKCWLYPGTHTHTNTRLNKNMVDFPAMNAVATNSPVSWLFSLFTGLDNFAERNIGATRTFMP
jgi:hypothetical protein